MSVKPNSLRSLRGRRACVVAASVPDSSAVDLVVGGRSNRDPESTPSTPPYSMRYGFRQPVRGGAPFPSAGEAAKPPDRAARMGVTGSPPANSAWRPSPAPLAPGWGPGPDPSPMRTTPRETSTTDGESLFPACQCKMLTDSAVKTWRSSAASSILLTVIQPVAGHARPGNARGSSSSARRAPENPAMVHSRWATVARRPRPPAPGRGTRRRRGGRRTGPGTGAAPGGELAQVESVRLAGQAAVAGQEPGGANSRNMIPLYGMDRLWRGRRQRDAPSKTED